jgi:hypothetical protein
MRRSCRPSPEASAQSSLTRWPHKETARTKLLGSIRDVLDTGLPPACTPELCRLKCAAVFAHAYERYPERQAETLASRA